VTEVVVEGLAIRLLAFGGMTVLSEPFDDAR